MGQYFPMPRFFMHVRTDTSLAEDTIGIELTDLEAARAEASADLREIVAEAIRCNLLVGHPRIEVYDAAKTLLATISIRDAIDGL